MLSRIYFYLSPNFLIERYLCNDLKEILKKHRFKEEVIDIGCGNKPFAPLFDKTEKYTGIDFKKYSTNKHFAGLKPDLYFKTDYLSTLKLPFVSQRFGNSVSFQVLEHHKDPQKLIDEMFRVTKKGGLIMISAPLIWGLHEIPHDYFRFTEYGFFEMFKKHKHKVLEIRKQGSLASTISVLLNDSLVEYVGRGGVRRVTGLIIYPIFLFYSYLSILIDRFINTENVFLNYIILVRKTDR